MSLLLLVIPLLLIAWEMHRIGTALRSGELRGPQGESGPKGDPGRDGNPGPALALDSPPLWRVYRNTEHGWQPGEWVREGSPAWTRAYDSHAQALKRGDAGELELGNQ